MTSLEAKLRAALRDTADEIPADPPPLRLPPRRLPWLGSDRGTRGTEHGWVAWAAPLASAALVVAVVAGSLALTGGAPGSRLTTATPGTSTVPPYYVALTGSGIGADPYEGAATAAEVRATATGAVLATVVPPRPYVHFAGVTAAADHRTFVLVAQEAVHLPNMSARQYHRTYPQGYFPASRFYLLHVDADQKAGAHASLRALPAGFIPANQAVHDMALSPDGTSLAANVGPELGGSPLTVFNLATGIRRAWSFKPCGACNPDGGGLGFGGTNADALSWTADGRYLAFVGPGRSLRGPSAVRLLDVTAPGSDLLASSRPVATLPPGDNMTGLTWRGAIVTPDGRTVVIVEELANDQAPIQVRDRLLKVSVATGRVTVVNDENVLAGYWYEQVMYTSYTGNVLVVSGARRGSSAGILRGDSYTPILWNSRTASAAW